MKNVLLICCMLITLISFSQSKVSFSIQQDARLLLVGDQKGNSPLTANLLAKVEIPVYSFEKNHLSVYPVAEYADLIGASYERYAAGIAYTVKSLYGKIGAVAFLDYGTIRRGHDDRSFSSFSLSGELNFPLTDHLKVICTQQLTQRKDLTEIYNSDNGFVISGFIGLKYNF